MHNQRKPQLHPLTPSYFHHHSPSISISSASGSSSLGPITPVDADEVFIGQLWQQVRSSKRPSSDNFIPAALQHALDEEERERAREREFEREKERERGGREQPREKEKEQQHTSSGTRSGMESMIKGYGYGLSAAAVAASPAAAAKPVIAPNMSQTPSSSRRRKSIVYRESSDKRNMVVILELPGVDKADVHVTFQPKRLVVSYKTVSETEHREFDRVIQETVERRVARALPLPETVRPALWREMAGLNLNLSSFTENTSRLGARISESIAEHTRDLAITRGPGAAYFDAPEDKVRAVRRQLDSNSDREKLDALKTLIALISKGRNVSDFLAHVVKNVASPNLEIRKLVYIFLLRYAEVEPDLALLSINTFQKDLTDANPLIRAMALRVLSGINVPMVGNIVILAVKKCATDPSPYVRKAAAFALIKCYKMDPAHLPSLIPILQTLLKDRSPLSIGAVSIAFQTICPTRLDLLHTHYRRLCRTLLDADSWGQVNVLELLAKYARSMLPKPTVSGTTTDGDTSSEKDEIDPDLQLLLTNAEPLFMSNNPAVVMTVSRVFFYLAPPSQLSKIVTPLLRLLPISKEISRITLANLSIIIDEIPYLFAPYYSHFLIKTTDIKKVKLDKLNILLKLLSPDNYQALLREFVFYSEDADTQIASEAIQAIGRCARTIPDSSQQCISVLMDFIKTGSAPTVSSSVLVLKNLVQARLESPPPPPPPPPSSSLAPSPGPASATTSQSPTRNIADLANRLEDIKHPTARACIIWLVGQYASLTGSQNEKESSETSISTPTATTTATPTSTSMATTMAQLGLAEVAWFVPDVLRRVAKTFSSEEPIVKLQVLTLASKLQVLLTSPHPTTTTTTPTPTNPTTNPTTTITLLTRYIFSLARYDVNYDVRDRARMLGSLLAGISPSLRLYLNGNSNSSSNNSRSNTDEDEEDEEGDEEGKEGSNNRAYRRGGVVLRREQVRLVLFEGKSVVQDRPLSKEPPPPLGSLELLTSKPTGLESTLRLPDWPEEGTDSSLRDSKEEVSAAAVQSPTQTQFSSRHGAGSSFASGSSMGAGVGTGSNMGTGMQAPRSISSQGQGQVQGQGQGQGAPVVLTPTGRDSPALNGGKGVWKNLDEFLDESEEEEEEEEEGDEEEEDEEGEEEEEDGEEDEEESAEEESDDTNGEEGKLLNQVQNSQGSIRIGTTEPNEPPNPHTHSEEEDGDDGEEDDEEEEDSESGSSEEHTDERSNLR